MKLNLVNKIAIIMVSGLYSSVAFSAAGPEEIVGYSPEIEIAGFANSTVLENLLIAIGNLDVNGARGVKNQLKDIALAKKLYVLNQHDEFFSPLGMAELAMKESESDDENRKRINEIISQLKQYGARLSYNRWKQYFEAVGSSAAANYEESVKLYPINELPAQLEENTIAIRLPDGTTVTLDISSNETFTVESFEDLINETGRKGFVVTISEGADGRKYPHVFEAEGFDMYSKTLNTLIDPINRQKITAIFPITLIKDLKKYTIE